MAKEIYYLRGRGEEHAELLLALRARGFNPKVTRSLDELLARFLREPPPAAVFVDASISDAETAERVVELQTAEELFEIPTVLIGHQAKERSGLLRQRYRLLIPVEFPFRVDYLLEQLAKVEPGLASSNRVKGAISQPNPLKLEDSYGGEVFAKASSYEAFDDSLLIPSNRAAGIMKETLDYLSKKNSWLGAHARRTAFLAAAIQGKLHGQELPELRVAGLFLNWALVESERGLKIDIFREGNELHYHALADSFRISADSVHSVFGDDQAAAIIQGIAEIMLGEFSGSPSQRTQAESVLATEFSDRACWITGHWDRNAVPRVLRMLRESPLFVVPEVKSAMASVLGESLSLYGKPTNVDRPLTSKERSEREKQVSMARTESAKIRLQDTRRIKLFDLKPGMQLAEPLVSLDGKLILRVDTILDFDMCMRILQLSGSRSMPAEIRIIRVRMKKTDEQRF